MGCDFFELILSFWGGVVSVSERMDIEPSKVDIEGTLVDIEH